MVMPSFFSKKRALCCLLLQFHLQFLYASSFCLPLLPICSQNFPVNMRAVLEQRKDYFRHPFSLERKKGAISFSNMYNQQIALINESARPEGFLKCFFTETISVVFTLQFYYLSFQKLTSSYQHFCKGIHASNDFVLLGT